MQDRITAGNIEIRCSAIYFAEIMAVIEGVLHLLPVHGKQAGMIPCRVDIAMLASLITFICYMPLKRKIRFHDPTLQFLIILNSFMLTFL